MERLPARAVVGGEIPRGSVLWTDLIGVVDGKRSTLRSRPTVEKCDNGGDGEVRDVVKRTGYSMADDKEQAVHRKRFFMSITKLKTSAVCGPYLQTSAEEKVVQTSTVCWKKTVPVEIDGDRKIRRGGVVDD
ncbi:hypothetical protein LXL04_025250 [Taraxacum kok-saghyz]